MPATNDAKIRRTVSPLCVPLERRNDAGHRRRRDQRRAWSYYGLRAQANNSTIFVAAQGTANGWANTGGRDLTLTDDLIKLIEGDLCVDTTKVFALGFSYGGAMSYALACARPTVFRAVAVYSGGVLSGCDGGTQPVAYLGIHGLGDGTLNISGGRSMCDKFVMTTVAPRRTRPSRGRAA